MIGSSAVSVIGACSPTIRAPVSVADESSLASNEREQNSESTAQDQGLQALGGGLG